MRQMTYDSVDSPSETPDLRVRAVLERYKALGAVLALGEFSVADVALLSGVGEATVRTTLRREKKYVEQIGTQASGRRGGQPVRWRLRPEAREPLRDVLRGLEQLGVGPWLGEREEASHTPRAGLIAAMDVLLHMPPLWSDSVQRAELVKLAQAHYDAAIATEYVSPGAAAPADRPAEPHRRAVELLLALERAERLAEAAHRAQPTQEDEDLLTGLREAARDLDDKRLAHDIVNRMGRSPFWLVASRDPHPLFGQLVPPVHPSLATPALDPIVDRLQEDMRALEVAINLLQLPPADSAETKISPDVTDSPVADDRSVDPSTFWSESLERDKAPGGQAGANDPDLGHSEVLSKIFAYLDGDLDDDDVARIREHLDECRPCLREYGLEESVKRLVRRHCGIEVPPRDLRAKVQSRIKQVMAAAPAEYRLR